MKIDLFVSKLLTNPHKEAEALYSQYYSTLSSLIGKHTPPHTKHVKEHYVQIHTLKYSTQYTKINDVLFHSNLFFVPGWVTKGVIAAKEINCLCECIWNRNNSRSIDHTTCRKVINAIKSA